MPSPRRVARVSAMNEDHFTISKSFSWCYWAEPAWAELKQRYAGQVEFDWKIAQMPAEAYPHFQGAGRVVLSAQWHDCQITVHAQRRLVRGRAEDLRCAESRRRSRKRFW